MLTYQGSIKFKKNLGIFLALCNTYEHINGVNEKFLRYLSVADGGIVHR